MTEILIRKAEKKDLPAIQRLLSTYFLDMEELEPEDFVLAEKEGKVIGCAALIRATSNEKNFLEIHSIAVHPNLRGKGIGTRLMEYLIKTIDSPETPGAPGVNCMYGQLLLAFLKNLILQHCRTLKSYFSGKTAEIVSILRSAHSMP